MFRKLLLASVMVGVAHTALAQEERPCASNDLITKQLEKQHGEVPVVFAMQLNGKLLQVFVSEENDTWTMVETLPEGRSCIVAAGRHWTPVTPSSTDPMA